MARMVVCDTNGRITADIEACGPVLGEALEHEKAESVIRCAVLMAVSVLAQGGTWPGDALQLMAAFMAVMKEGVASEQLM